MRPNAIIITLDLRRPLYRQTAAYGHFGWTDIDLPWERTDKAEQLCRQAGHLAAGDGHPAEVMDMSFSIQALVLEHLVKNRGLGNHVYKVPEDIDNKVAMLKIQALGLKIDQLSAEQQRYLSSWQA